MAGRSFDGPRRRPGALRRRILAPIDLAIIENVADSAVQLGLSANELCQRFEVNRESGPLAEGGQKFLFKAEDKEGNVVVAWLESKEPVLQDSKSVALWRQEANTMLQFHDSAIQLLACGEISVEGGKVHPVMVQEYTELGNLYDRIEGAQMVAKERADYFRQAVQPLAVIHELGFIHGDVKPTNYLVVRRGRDKKVVLTDFATSHQPSVRPFRSPFGTPGFESPERCVAGNAMQYTTSADLYSLGPLALELLCDTQPWSEFYVLVGEDMAVAFYQEILTSMNIAAIPFILTEELALKTDELNGFAEIITNLMHFAPRCRYTCVQLIDHPLLFPSKQIQVHEFQSGAFAKSGNSSKTISLVVAISTDAGGAPLQPITVNIRMDCSDFRDILKSFSECLHGELISIFECAQKTAIVDRAHIVYRRTDEFVPIMAAWFNRIHALAQRKFKIQNVEAFRRNEKVFADWELKFDGDGPYIRLNEEGVKDRIEGLGLLWPRTIDGNLLDDE